MYLYIDDYRCHIIFITPHIIHCVNIPFPFPTPSLHQQHRGAMHFIWLQSHRPWMQQLVVFWLVPMEKLPSGEKWYISCHEMEMESWWWVSWGCFFLCFPVDVFFLFSRLGFLDREIRPFTRQKVPWKCMKSRSVTILFSSTPWCHIIPTYQNLFKSHFETNYK